jgi:four helix bundle protein
MRMRLYAAATKVGASLVFARPRHRVRLKFPVVFIQLKTFLQHRLDQPLDRPQRMVPGHHVLRGQQALHRGLLRVSTAHALHFTALPGVVRSGRRVVAHRDGLQRSAAVADEMERMRFDHEQLDVYKVAMDFVALAHEVIRALPTGHGELADQLRRASISIVLNIAEGAGEYSKAEKARIYRIARRSATECAAVLEIGSRFEVVSMQHAGSARDLLLRVVSMLTKVVRALHA